MSRQSDPESPAAAVQPAPGDCVADVGAEVLEEVAVYHDYAEPPDTPVNAEELV
jgi:hypothetical protein